MIHKKLALYITTRKCWLVLMITRLCSLNGHSPNNKILSLQYDYYGMIVSMNSYEKLLYLIDLQLDFQCICCVWTSRNVSSLQCQLTRRKSFSVWIYAKKTFKTFLSDRIFFSGYSSIKGENFWRKKICSIWNKS